jgi:hypothetical protein
LKTPRGLADHAYTPDRKRQKLRDLGSLGIAGPAAPVRLPRVLQMADAPVATRCGSLCRAAADAVRLAPVHQQRGRVCALLRKSMMARGSLIGGQEIRYRNTVQHGAWVLQQLVHCAVFIG